jgi:hypothetical protein
MGLQPLGSSALDARETAARYSTVLVLSVVDSESDRETVGSKFDILRTLKIPLPGQGISWPPPCLCPTGERAPHLWRTITHCFTFNSSQVLILCIRRSFGLFSR